METLNNENFKANIIARLDDLLATVTKEDMDKAMVRLTRDLQRYADLKKEILEFNELYSYYEKVNAE